jgi:hypothetical protein
VWRGRPRPRADIVLAVGTRTGVSAPHRPWAGILLHTCVSRCASEKVVVFHGPQFGPGELPLENVRCLRCSRELEPGRKFVTIYMFAQTVGIKPRQKSSAQRMVFCPQCSVSLALGLSPEGALNIAAWDMIRDLVSSGPELNQAAWENLRGLVHLLEAGETAPPEPEPAPEPKHRSDAWVNFSRAG